MNDKILTDNLDQVDDLEIAIEKEVDKLLSALTIDDFLINAKDTLDEVAKAVYEIVRDKYAGQAVKLGIDLAENIKKVADA